MELPKIIQAGDRTVKLFNWMDYPRGRPARNVECYDAAGRKLWVIASLGEGMPESDFYTDIGYGSGRLWAFNYQCYQCEINIDNGEILSAQFTK